jgi:hypothetical protein
MVLVSTRLLGYSRRRRAMGIDRIGKGPPTAAPEIAGGAGAEKSGAVGKTFEVAPREATHGASSVGPGGLDPASPLAKLRAGEVDAKGYVDLQVEAATKGLEGLPPADLAEIKKVLRDQMVSDPGLSDLLRQATGQAPPTPEADGD